MSMAVAKLSGETHTDHADALTVMAFVADDVTRQALIRLSAEQKWQDPVIQMGGIAAARKEMAALTSPSMLIVDLSESSDPLSDINDLADVCEPGTRVIALGTANDLRLYRSLLDAGVTDYMVKPVVAADLARAVAHAISGGKPESVEAKRGQIMAVIGARGGVGSSTVAINLAWLMSQEQKQRTVLVDFDLYFGIVPLSLDIDAGTGFREVLNNPSRIDPLFLERAAIRVNETLAILGTEESLSGGAHWNVESFIPLITELGKAFDNIVIDLPRNFAIQHPELIASAATTVLVTDLSLSAMRDSLRLKALTRENAPHTRLKVLVNHHRPSGKGDMPVADFEHGIEEKIVCTIPFDSKGVAQAASAGQPLAAVAKKSASADALRKFTQSLAATKAKKSGGFALARLFKS